MFASYILELSDKDGGLDKGWENTSDWDVKERFVQFPRNDHSSIESKLVTPPMNLEAEWLCPLNLSTVNFELKGDASHGDPT